MERLLKSLKIDNYKNLVYNIIMVNKIKKHGKFKLIFIISAILLISLLISIFYLDLSNKIKVFNNKEDSTQTTNQNYSENVNKVDYGPPKPEDTVISPEKTNKDPKEEVLPKGSPISVLITRANRDSVGVYIEKITEGICELKVTQNGVEKINITAKVIAQSEYSSCEGFRLDSSKLDGSVFKVTVSVTSGDRLGSTSQEVK